MPNQLIPFEQARKEMIELQLNSMKSYIAKTAEHVKKAIVGGSIYGIPVKPDTDLETLIAAAYFLGRNEESNERKEKNKK
jgi:hypothetical protein